MGIEKEKYSEALDILNIVGSYKNSAELVQKCNDGIKTPLYNNAVSLMNAKQYDEALEVFDSLGDFKDSKTKIIEIGKVNLKSGNVGDAVYFGDLLWQIIDKTAGKILIISKDVVEKREYHYDWDDITWAECSLRAYLNGDFYKNHFSDEEQAKILSTNLSNPDNPEYGTEGGVNTTDKIFLLSIEEANRYFSSNDARDCGDDWWLRSPGHSSRNAVSVFSLGSIFSWGSLVNDNINGIRPAMWISVNS